MPDVSGSFWEFDQSSHLNGGFLNGEWWFAGAAKVRFSALRSPLSALRHDPLPEMLRSERTDDLAGTMIGV